MLLVIDVVEAQKSEFISQADIEAEIQLIMEFHSEIYAEVFLSSLEELSQDDYSYSGVVFTTPQIKSDRIEFYKFIATSKSFSQLALITADGTGSGDPEIFRALNADVVSWLYKSNISLLDTVKERKKILDGSLQNSSASAISRYLISQINSVFSLIEDIYIVSNILSKRELDSFSTPDCGTLCSMGYLKSTLRWLDSKGSRSPDSLRERYASSLKDSITNVLNFRYEGNPIQNENQLSKSYLALGALAYNLSHYYLAMRGSSTSFILSVRALEFYLISILLSVGDIEVRRESSGFSCLFLNNKKVSGVGGLWTACVRRFEVNEEQENVIRSYIDVRNSSILAHGFNLTSEEYVEKTLDYTYDLIKSLENQMYRPTDRWDQLVQRTGIFLNYDLGEVITSIYEKSNNIRTF